MILVENKYTYNILAIFANSIKKHSGSGYFCDKT